MSQASQPTVEEILESIKQVIARDTRDGGVPGSKGTDAAACPPHYEPDPDEILDLAESGALIAEDEGEDAESLINRNAQTSMRESLAALAMLSEPGAQPQIVRSGETSLEGLVREMLRPALAEWLDKNLPPLVEEMVAAEIKRIVGKKA